MPTPAEMSKSELLHNLQQSGIEANLARGISELSPDDLARLAKTSPEAKPKVEIPDAGGSRVPDVAAKMTVETVLAATEKPVPETLKQTTAEDVKAMQAKLTDMLQAEEAQGDWAGFAGNVLDAAEQKRLANKAEQN